MMLGLAFPGTPIGWWLEQDDRTIATAIDVLEQQRKR